MKPIFMVVRKDGLSDNIYEYDFKNGKFTGSKNKIYTYDDIANFNGLSCEIIKSIMGEKGFKEKFF